MADFDAILRKALASRPDASGEERRKIYERARQALIRQLTGFEPPLPPEDISRQRLALESAIRKVEADVAANGGVLPGAAATAAAASAAPAAAASPPVEPAPAEPAPSPAPAMPRAEPLATDAPAAPVPPVTPAAGASAEPAYVGDPEPSQLPDFEPAAPAPTDSASQPAEVPLAAAAAKPKGKSPVGLILSVLVLALVAGGGVYAWQTGALDGLLGQSEPQTAEEEALPVAPDNDVRQVGGTDPTRSSERLLPDNQGTVEEPLETETPSAETPVELSPPESDATETTQAPEEPAAEEAAPETEVAAAPTEPGLPVAQTAILYEEGLTPEATGFTAPGRTVWRLEGGDSDPVIVGTVEIPNRGISMNLRVSRNLDAALPASHLLEFTFNLADGFPAESIAELVGVVVKPEEQSGGDPLRGAIVDLGSGVFWQALAAGDADVAVNLPLLRDGRWFDLPVLYADNRRAIISFEKGVDGERVFNEALAAWSN